MPALSPKLHRLQGHMVAYWCPGCKKAHQIPIGEGQGPRWRWNGDPTAIQFSPSVLVRDGHFAPGHTGHCWCDWNRDHPDQPAHFKCGICHSFVGGVDGRHPGMIQFLSDSTHELAGQLVPVPDFPHP